MTVIVKNKTPLVIPPAVSRRAGIKSGDELEFRVSGRVITIVPKSSTPADQCTPEQRRIIDRGIAKGLDDIRKGRVHGPFETADTAIAHLESLARSRKRTPSRKSS